MLGFFFYTKAQMHDIYIYKNKPNNHCRDPPNLLDLRALQEAKIKYLYISD